MEVEVQEEETVFMSLFIYPSYFGPVDTYLFSCDSNLLYIFST